jgi:hypothetical protein
METAMGSIKWKRRAGGIVTIHVNDESACKKVGKGSSVYVITVG